MAGWKRHVKANAQVFNNSPLAARLQKKFTFRLFLHILKGMNRDHASTEKSTGCGVADLKHEDGLNELRENVLGAMSLSELVLYLQAWNAKKIADAGGISAWEALSPTEQSERDKALMAEVVAALGQEEYDALTPEEKHRIDLFIWAGCCMHKDQNSFLGGSKEMACKWEQMKTTPPMLLANKANSITLQHLLEPGAKVPDTLTKQEQKSV